MPLLRNLPASRQRHPRGGIVRSVLLLLLLAAVGGGLYAWRSGGGAPSAARGEQALWHEVEKRDFELTVTERGEVQSAGSTEVRSEVKSMNSSGVAILQVVPEGTVVQKGDFLVELDSSALRADRLLQQIAVNTAEAASVEAKNLYETTLIAREEYLEGVFVQERQTIQSEVFVAEENLRRARDYFEYSRKLATKGYVNELQLEADRFAVEKSQKELDAAETKLRVLEEFTRAKMLKQLDSDIVIAKAKWESLRKSHELENDKLADIEDQIAKCKITAPKDGTVKYAHGEESRDQNQFLVEEGALVRERQTIILLPDSSRMRVAVEVNEALIQHVRQGMPATVSPVGAEGVVLRGTVSKVNQYAEASDWRRANVKDYKVFVTIDQEAAMLKSGMTASVTISSEFVPDAVQAPVQAVYPHGDKLYCFVRRGDKREERIEATPVECGPMNDRFFVIRSGLEPGDRVAVNPRQLAERVELPAISADQSQVAVDTGAQGRELRERLAAEKTSADTATATR